MAVEPTVPASSRVLVRPSILLHMGLHSRTWPDPLDWPEARHSPWFQTEIGADYRIDLLYLSHLVTLKIAQGTPTMWAADVWESIVQANVPDLPNRGIPIAYIIMFGTETIETKQIVDCRPYLTTVTSPDVDEVTFWITDDLSDQLNGVRTVFTPVLPFAPNTVQVKLNGIVQTKGQAYSETGLGYLETYVSGGSLSDDRGTITLTFAPNATEELEITYELGHKGDYSGYGQTPWGTGPYGV